MTQSGWFQEMVSKEKHMFTTRYGFCHAERDLPNVGRNKRERCYGKKERMMESNISAATALALVVGLLLSDH